VRILHVIPYFVPAYGFGGPVTACHDIAATQVTLGHAVTVVTTDALELDSRVDARHEMLDGIEVVRFPNLSARLAKQRNLFLPRGLGAWVRDRLRGFDVVHLHDYFTYQNVLISHWCRRLGIPYVLQPHGIAAPPSDQRLYLVKSVFARLWGRAMLRGAASIFAVSAIERDRLLAYAPELGVRVVQVGNGLRLPEARRAPVDRATLGLRPEHKVILSLGRLHETKGFDRLLRAFSILVARDDSFRLLIAGSDNGAEPSLRKLIATLRIGDQVRLLGLTVGEEKERVYAASDVFSLLSRYESFAIVVLEALAHGLPVCLSPQVGVAAELAPRGCAVIVRDADDPEEVARSLGHTYARRAELGGNARAAAASYDVRAVVGEMMTVYDEALRNPARTAAQ
jgi:glycosyltransferase involved in cell wall biosynthesis